MIAFWAPHTVGGRPRCGVDTATGTCVPTGAPKMSGPLASHRTPDLGAKSQENDWDRNDLMKENCLIFIEFPWTYGSCTHKGFLFIWKFWWKNEYLIGDCFVGSTHCGRQANQWHRHRAWHMRARRGPAPVTGSLASYRTVDLGGKSQENEWKIHEKEDSVLEKSIICLIRVDATQNDVFVENSRSVNSI